MEETQVITKQEVLLKGSGAAPGIALGNAFVFKKVVPHVADKPIEAESVEAEIDRLDRALVRSQKELTKILAFAEQKLGENKAKIFEAQIMVLQDEILIASIK